MGSSPEPIVFRAINAARVDPAACRAVRMSLVGQRLDRRESVGDEFDYPGRGPRGQALRLRLESLPAQHLVVSSASRIVILGADDAADEIRMTDDAVTPRSRFMRNTTSPTEPAKSNFADLVESLRGVLLTFADFITIVDPRDVGANERAKNDVAALEGVPSAEILSLMAARLHGNSWLDDWSARHGYALDATHLMRNSNIVVFAGDPGTGKTQLAHASPGYLAAALGEPVVFVQLSTRLRGQGVQGKGASDVLNALEAMGEFLVRNGLPAIIFLDEAEAVGASRVERDAGGGGAQENLAIVDALIVGIDRLFAISATRGVVLLATNLPRSLDPALRRRGTTFNFPRPSRDARISILSRVLGSVLDTGEIEQLNTALDALEPAPTAADLITQLVVPAVYSAAIANRRIASGELIQRAALLVPTPAGY